MRHALQVVPDVFAGLALEAELFSAPETGVCLWSATSPALVCPAAFSLRDSFDVASVQSAERGWPIKTRPTGGGVVPQGIGVLNLAIAATVGAGFTIEEGYRLITRPIATCLGRVGLAVAPGPTPHSFCDGGWNLSVAGQKVVGTAQRWRPLRDKKVRLLAHALILTHGKVEQGAVAVDAFQRDLGLSIPVRADVHTTIESALEGNAPTMSVLATELYTAAKRELGCVGLHQRKLTAA